MDENGAQEPAQDPVAEIVIAYNMKTGQLKVRCPQDLSPVAIAGILSMADYHLKQQAAQGAQPRRSPIVGYRGPIPGAGPT